MRIRHYLSAMFAAALVLASCQPKETQPEEMLVTVSPASLEFSAGIGDNAVSLTATRDWNTKIECQGSDADWISVNPAEGKWSTKDQTVTITVKENTGFDREATVEFSIGLKKATVAVKQSGPQGEDERGKPKGTGTEADPFNPTAAIAKAKEVGQTASTEFYYIKGFVSSVKEIETEKYGNASFYIKDAMDGDTEEFYCFQIMYLGGGKFTSADQLKAGDEVTVCAKIVNYMGNTPETDGKGSGRITEINGQKEEKKDIGTPKGTGTAEDPFNATAAIAKAKEIGQTASTEFYYVKGFVSNVKEIETEKYGNASFYIRDAKDGNTEEFYCFQIMYLGGAKFTSTDQLKVGDEVTVCAQIVNYMGNTPETNGKGSGRVVEHNGTKEKQAENVDTEKVSEVIAADDNSNITLKNVLVVANSPNGYLVTDGTDYVLAYMKDAGTPPAVGDKVNVTGVKSTYGEMPQISTPAFTVVSSGNPVSTPSIEDITGSLGSFSSTKVKYVSITGKLSIESDKYYNITVSGVSGVQGAFITPSFDVTAFAGLDGIRYEGYYVYTTSNQTTKFIYLILTSAAPVSGSFFSVNTADIKVAADATSAEISVAGNVDWTASSDNAAFTLDKASGSGEGKIKVTFPANTEFEARTANITVATTADVSVKSFTVKVIQAAAPDPNAKVVELTNDEIVASFAASAQTGSVYDNWTVSSASGDWKGNMNTQKGLAYVQLRNTMDAHLLTPEFSSEIVKIEVTAYASNGTTSYTRKLYAVPVSTDTKTPNKDTKFSAAVIENAYAQPISLTGAKNEEASGTMEFTTTGVKQCKLVSYDGALYIRSIKVYLK